MPPSARDQGFGLGTRGSARRAFITIGICLLVLASAGTVVYVVQTPVKQVYWGVYARLYPLKEHPTVATGARKGLQATLDANKGQSTAGKHAADGAEAAAVAVQKRAGDSSVQSAARQLLPKAGQEEPAATKQLEQLTTTVKPEQEQQVAEEKAVLSAEDKGQDWPKEPQQQKARLKRISQSRAAQLQDQEDSAQWDQAVQEKAAKEQALEAALSGSTADGTGATSAAGKGQLARPGSRKKPQPAVTTGHADRGRKLSK